jgi:arylsulfatase A-like enzyme
MLVLAVLCSLQLLACRAEVVGPRRIILLVMDTVRADRVAGHDGAAADATPALREIAAEGVLFRRFYAAANYTLPAHMSMFTGLDPDEHRVGAPGSESLLPGVVTLAGLLREAGYRSQAFHEGGFVAARFGFARGFDSYTHMPRATVVGENLGKVLRWLREREDEPYFLFLHTYAAHRPYGGYDRHRARYPERLGRSERDIGRLLRRYPLKRRKEFLDSGKLAPELVEFCTLFNQFADRQLGCGGAFLPPDYPSRPHFEEDIAGIIASYDDRVARIDVAVRKIRAVLRERGEWEDTLLVVTSDHGEAFFEHGIYMHDYAPFDEVLRVPLIISYPRVLRVGGGRVVDGIAWHLDLMPTILGLAGVAVPDGLQGVDLTPVLLGRDELARDRAIFPRVSSPQDDGRPVRRVVIRGFSKHFDGHPEFGDEQGMLFDLARDPNERENLWRSHTELREELLQRRDEYQRSLRRPTAEPVGEGGDPLEGVPEDEEAFLRALGYLD